MSASLIPLAAAALDARVRIAAVIVTALLVGFVLELVRRRRLVERYALLWMMLSLALLVLAVWNQLLGWFADRLGIQVPANFLFIAAFGVAFVILLHFSVAISRLSEETKILGQEVGRLDAELRALREGRSNGAGSAPEAQSALADEPPSRASTADQ